MNNWKSNFTQIMVATSTFGMGINSNDIRVVIHAEAPMSMMHLFLQTSILGINKLECAAKKIFKVIYYCNSGYECHQQLIWQYQAWPNEEKPPVCEICDNCINRITDKPRLIDGKEEIIKLLEVVEYLTQEMGV
ncbi:unnamed protein product [Rhizophagus irregularis]|nr:unnamed protein product [Rhizophagus irregularis]CAB4421403.1 unnamed protein product [Rhizophagus irregularis]